MEKRLKHRDGREVWTSITISLVRDAEGRPFYTLAMFEDITERRRLGDRLAYQALHDPLTRLPNRTLFFDRLNAACLPAPQRPGSSRAGGGSVSATSTWTASRRSTTPSATTSATSC